MNARTGRVCKFAVTHGCLIILRPLHCYESSIRNRKKTANHLAGLSEARLVTGRNLATTTSTVRCRHVFALLRNLRWSGSLRPCLSGGPE